MHGKSERYEIGGSPLHLQVGAVAAHLSIPAGHIDTARKVVDLLGHTLRERQIAFTLQQGENTVQFLFGEIGSGRIQNRQNLDGESFRSVLCELQEKLPTLEALNQAHAGMRQSWAGKAGQRDSAVITL